MPEKAVTSMFAGLRRMRNSISAVKRARKDRDLTEKAEKAYRILWRSNSTAAEKLCYFSSFDPDAIVDATVFHYLGELKRNGYDIVFVTTSSQVGEEDLCRLRELTQCVVLRENHGLDFFSWKTGLRIWPLASGTRFVLFANDSVYGPVFPLEDVLRQIENADLEMVGITDSWYYAYHLHSYFLHFKLSNRMTDIVTKYFDRVRVISDKWELIKSYEIGLSQELLRNGCKIGALLEFRNLFNRFGSAELRERSERVGGNSMYLFWREFGQLGLNPFMKRGIFREIGPWETIFSPFFEQCAKASGSAFDYSLIINHLKRSLR